jgi:hypothetical protein
MQPIINKIKRTARLTEVLAGAPQTFTLTLSLLPSPVEEAKRIRFRQLAEQMDKEEAQIAKNIAEDEALAAKLRNEHRDWSDEQIDAEIEKVNSSKSSNSDIQQSAQIKIEKIESSENTTKVGVEFNGPQEVLTKLSQAMKNDFIDYIKSIVNRKKPYNYIDDESYIEASGIMHLKKISDSSGAVIAEMIKGGGYKLLNPYIFNQEDIYIDEELPFMEMTFQTSL